MVDAGGDGVGGGGGSDDDDVVVRNANVNHPK